MGFTPEQIARLRGDMQKSRAKTESQFTDFSKYASLSGAQALAPPGKPVIVRLLPRWDLAKRYVRQGSQVVINPEYKEDPSLIYVPAREHWFDNVKTKKRAREWCRKLLNDTERCPLCEAADALLASDDDKDVAAGKSLRASEVFLFNVIIRKKLGKDAKGQPAFVDAQFVEVDSGVPGQPKRVVPDIKILPVGNTVFAGILETMVGGPDTAEGFAKGEVYDPKDGYDLQIIRPATQTDRYRVVCANNPTPLYDQSDTRWAGWMGMMHNLADEVSEKTVKSYNDLYEMFYGFPPEQSAGPVTSSAKVSAPVPSTPTAPPVQSASLDDPAFALAGPAVPAPASAPPAVPAPAAPEALDPGFAFPDFALPEASAPQAPTPAGKKR